MRDFNSPLALRLGGSAAAAVVAALTIGSVVALATASITLSGSTGDPLQNLGAGAIAGAAGALAAIVAYLVGIVIGVRRAVVEGRRAATVAALSLPLPLLAVASVVAFSWSFRPLVVVAGALLLLAVAVLVLAVSGALDGVLAVRFGGATAGAAAICVVLAILVHPADRGSALADRYRRAAVPVALIDGSTLDAPAPGWRLHSIEHPVDLGGGPRTPALVLAPPAVIWQVRGNYVQLQFVAQRGAALTACPPSCERLGATPEGAAIWAMRRPAGASPGYESIWVNVDGGRWQLAGVGPLALDVADAVTVLSRLKPVDVERFVAVAGLVPA